MRRNYPLITKVGEISHSQNLFEELTDDGNESQGWYLEESSGWPALCIGQILDKLKSVGTTAVIIGGDDLHCQGCVGRLPLEYKLLRINPGSRQKQAQLGETDERFLLWIKSVKCANRA